MKLDKYTILMWLLFVLLVGIGFFFYCVFFYFPQHTEKQEPLSEPQQLLQHKVIVIDPGHGGYDSGAYANGLSEKTINFDIATSLKETLEKEGTTVYLTRETDHNPKLVDRALFSAQKKADLFISLHINATQETSASGISTYFSQHLYKKEANPYPEKSKLLSDSIASHVSDSLGMENHGSYDQGFVVLRKNTVPSTLVELGFITNEEDAQKMQRSSFAPQAAEGIKAGILDYFKKIIDE
jgi:N-acetylmuramoyl-L-alanine amidase